ncbi:hypothetical protein VE03_10863 [Pseudogymnoascus sp. 23342-1-I1]|nr:hypothetical protein VE03_10863 [Pseudogymnoascus sp. 23342-1-I1]
MEISPKDQPGSEAVRKLLDTFYIDGPGDKHRCLVHPPLFESVLTFLRRNPVERLPSAVIAVVLIRLFSALDYLHTECQIVRTDINADNIMFGIKDDSAFRDLEEEELQRPVPRKEVDIDGRIIYMSQELGSPNLIGYPVLCDFAPEVILGVPWTYNVDIWNVGCMIWDIYEGDSLFTGQDPEFEKYQSRAHLAEIINLLGPPPPSLIAQGELRDKFFSAEGKSITSLTYGDFRTENLLTGQVPLEERETTLEGQEEREAFLRLMQKMLQWEPRKRCSAKELAEDEWIHKHL